MGKREWTNHDINPEAPARGWLMTSHQHRHHNKTATATIATATAIQPRQFNSAGKEYGDKSVRWSARWSWLGRLGLRFSEPTSQALNFSGVDTKATSQRSDRERVANSEEGSDGVLKGVAKHPEHLRTYR